jgi:ribosomal protein L37AE/L43A
MDVKEIARKDNLTLMERLFLEEKCRAVVQCSECRFAEKVRWAEGIYRCARLDRLTFPKDYCSRGEAK